MMIRALDRILTPAHHITRRRLARLISVLLIPAAWTMS